jgi:hypothetical protein
MTKLTTTLLAVALLPSGCAFTDATLKVRYDEALAVRGPLSSVEPRRVLIVPLADKRPEIDKIGWKKNGYGMKTAKIFSAKPVPEVVREALALELAKNGHRLASDPQVKLTGDVTEFWFDYQVGMFTIEFVGTVGMTLNVVDGQTGEAMYSGAYQGNYNEKSLGGLEGHGSGCSTPRSSAWCTRSSPTSGWFRR